MYIDHFLKMSSGQAVTVTAPSTDIIDFGQAAPNTGLHDRLDMVVTVGAAAAAAGAATVAIAIQDSANGTTFADVITSGALPVANLGAGAQVILPMPAIHRRYVRVNYTVASGPLTAGTFSAQVVEGVQANTPHPAA